MVRATRFFFADGAQISRKMLHFIVTSSSYFSERERSRCEHEIFFPSSGGLQDPLRYNGVDYFSAEVVLLADDFDIILGGARLPLITRIFGEESSSVVSIWAIETLAEAGTVVVPVGPAVELKHDLEVLDTLTPVDMLSAFSARESKVQIMSGLLRFFLFSG